MTDCLNTVYKASLISFALDVILGDFSARKGVGIGLVLLKLSTEMSEV